MRIHRSWKMALAMGVILVSGGCAESIAGGGAPQSPQPTGLSLLLAHAPTEGKAHRSCSLTLVSVLRPMREANGKALTRDKADAVEPKRTAPNEVRKAPAAVVHRPRVAKGAILASTKRP